MRKFNYSHNEHYGRCDTLHQYAEAVLDHVWTGLIVRARSGATFTYEHNRAYARSEIRRAIATAGHVLGTIDTTNNVCLRFTFEHVGKPCGITFWVPWDQIKGDLRTAGYPLDI